MLARFFFGLQPRETRPSGLDIHGARVYYPYMASIVGKKRGNQTYYYLVESARVDGKPRIVDQQYLGTSQELLARLAGAKTGQPERVVHRGFGDLAAVWTMLGRLGVAEAIDLAREDAQGRRRTDAGVSVGTYLALATANRVVAPCAKLAFAAWWATTAGPRFTKVSAQACDHRRFWDAMDTLDEDTLRSAERAIAARMISEFDLDLSALALDMTNFATFIDSHNPHAPIAMRGHAKQKRSDLRLVGLGLVVTRDGGVPVVSHAYPGNRPDVTQFCAVIDELCARYRALADPDGLSVVFDAGQNSEANFAHLTEAGLHYVGSLPPSEHPALLAIASSRYRVVDEQRFPGLRAHPARAAALGASRRVILTHSATLHAAQSRGFDQTLATVTRALGELAATLARGKTRRERALVEAAIAVIIRPRWVSRVLTTQLTGTRPAELRLSWQIDPLARRALESELFGKRILVTDHEDWPIAEVVAAYRSQSEVESGFRQLKDPKVVSFSPMFHWTDQKIRVHAFYCVLALAIAHLMRREAARAGIDISVRELLGTLAGITEIVLLYPGERGRPRARRMLTDLDPTQRRLYDLFALDRHAPRR